MVIDSVLEAAHRFAAQAMSKGDLVIDATVGNGHDTLFLARQVGPDGRVVGFDVQEEALEVTQQRLEENAIHSPVRLVHDGHETMIEHLGTDDVGTAAVVMFNLGYLPGADHTLTTTPETTRAALDASVKVLQRGGILTIVAYSGHEGGARETEAVASWASSLSQKSFQSLSYSFVNRANDPPQLFVVEKLSDPH